MEAVHASKMSVYFHMTTRHCTPEGCHFLITSRENLKTHNRIFCTADTKRLISLHSFETPDGARSYLQLGSTAILVTQPTSLPLHTTARQSKEQVMNLQDNE
jgi:hypothetical protein